ncbi:MAG: hypothetical protein ACUVSK_12060 [Desulfotomaculales bacterium]
MRVVPAIKKEKDTLNHSLQIRQRRKIRGTLTKKSFIAVQFL